jgi:hypothetical protein
VGRRRLVAGVDQAQAVVVQLGQEGVVAAVEHPKEDADILLFQALEQELAAGDACHECLLLLRHMSCVLCETSGDLVAG